MVLFLFCETVVTAKIEEIHAMTEACPDFLDCSLNLSGIDVAICSLLEIPEGTLTTMEELALIASTGFSLQYLIDEVHNGLAEVMDQTIDTFYPNTMRMVTTPVTLGAVTATLTTLYLAISYFPSVTSTVLQLRSGQIPLLRNKKLNVFRAAPDSVTTLTGAYVASPFLLWAHFAIWNLSHCILLCFLVSKAVLGLPIFGHCSRRSSNDCVLFCFVAKECGAKAANSCHPHWNWRDWSHSNHHHV
mmetsp:Transcript_5580/g.11449  ORF Transcript_5580/g.11449 Transcript_5580/m.11449 type:complete len:245 (-) Transcript_5580:1192-1926(-)